MNEHDNKPGRRQFMQIAALGAGVALLGSAAPKTAQAAGRVEAVLLSCMDFRLMDNIVHYMHANGYADNYDHLIIAGASLGAVTDKYPAWNKTFWEHLDVAIKLHNVAKLMIMDHRDCGAYKVILGEDFAKTPEKETHTHTAMLKQLKAEVNKRYPDLVVETMIMDLRGKVETISV